jgi:hypothetical protein
MARFTQHLKSIDFTEHTFDEAGEIIIGLE